MILGFVPLIDKHDNKESSHDEFNTRCIEMNYIAQQCTKCSPGNPINLIEKRYKNINHPLSMPSGGVTVQLMVNDSSHIPYIR